MQLVRDLRVDFCTAVHKECWAALPILKLLPQPFQAYKFLFFHGVSEKNLADIVHKVNSPVFFLS